MTATAITSADLHLADPEDPLVTVPHGAQVFHLRRPGSVRELRCSPDADRSGMLLPLLTAIRNTTLQSCRICFPDDPYPLRPLSGC